MSALILRIDPSQARSGVLSLNFPNRAFIVEILLDRAGERIALGVSDVPGVWTVIATGMLKGMAHDGGDVRAEIFDIAGLALPVDVVTAGDLYADAAFAPYALDVIEDEHQIARIFPASEIYQQEPAPHLLVAEAAGAMVQGGVLYGGLQLESQGSKFFHSVAAAYQWRCAFTGMCQSSPDGRFQEGVVLGIDEPYELRHDPPSQGLFVSSSIAFCYRHGLLAIGEDYDILRHPKLEAEMRIFLDAVNRKALLVLPEEQTHWPDLDAARRHRQRFGF